MSESFDKATAGFPYDNGTAPFPAPYTRRTPTDEEVICPECTHFFRAIPTQVQRLLKVLGASPPFKPLCETCGDHGMVGNYLDTEPCSVCNAPGVTSAQVAGALVGYATDPKYPDEALCSKQTLMDAAYMLAHPRPDDARQKPVSQLPDADTPTPANFRELFHMAEAVRIAYEDRFMTSHGCVMGPIDGEISALKTTLNRFASAL